MSVRTDVRRLVHCMVFIATYVKRYFAKAIKSILATDTYGEAVFQAQLQAYRATTMSLLTKL